MFMAAQFLNALNNVSLSNFKTERFVHRFQPFFLRLDVSLDLCYHCRELFLALLSCFSIDIVRFPLAICISWTVPTLIEVVVYHSHTACAGFATFGLVRLEIGRGCIYPCPFLSPRNFGVCAANLAVYLRCRFPNPNTPTVSGLPRKA